MRARAALTVGAAIGLASTTCIIPDRDIGFAGGPGNPGAVRILFRPPMMAEMEEFCNDADNPDPTFCPAARASRPSGLISAGPQSPFCICPSGRDNRAIDAFNIYVEDPDVSRDVPTDTLYGVLLLDPDPESETPSNAVAYGNYLEPCGVGSDISATQSRPPRAVPSEAREEIPQRLFRLDDGSSRGTIDLCNDDNGAPVTPGLHNLQFMVTDRPFFRPQLVEIGEDDMPQPIVGADGEPVLGPQQCGVPDLASGATYAVADYVFECREAGEETDPDGECDCAGGDG